MLNMLYAAAALGALLQSLAALTVLVLPFRAGGDQLVVPRVLAILGACCFALLLVVRGVYYRLLPLTSGVESLSLLVVMLVATTLLLTFDPKRRSLLMVYLPAIAAISIVAALLAPQELSSPPKALSASLLLLHVVPAFLAYAWFFIAMLTSGVYLYQASRLKRRAPLAAMQHLPSLEQLDATLFNLIRMAYPLFVLTLVLGAYWAWYDRALLGAYWFLSPKIILSLCMVVIYAVAYHGRAAGWLRGPRLANVLVIGIGGLLASYLVLEILNLTNYNFWGAAA